MRRRSWERAERLSWPMLLAELVVRGSGRPRGLIEETVRFGDHPRQRIVTIRPIGRATKPVLVFVHGGSWQHGRPEDFRAVGRFFARRGYPTVLSGYRLAPDHLFPTQLHDVLDGMACLGTQEWFAEGTPVILAGQSAGGHLAALAAFDERTRTERGLGELRLLGLLSVSGVVDFDVLCPRRSKCPLVEALMGGRDGWAQADPARFVHGSTLPVLCLHGSHDPLVPVEVSASFVLRADGSEGDHASFIADPHGHHSDMVRVFFGTSPLTSPMLQWLEDVSEGFEADAASR